MSDAHAPTTGNTGPDDENTGEHNDPTISDPTSADPETGTDPEGKPVENPSG